MKRNIKYCLGLIFISVLLSQNICGAVDSFYVVGEYGYLQKYNSKLILINEVKLPSLVRTYTVNDADISPTGDKLYLAIVSQGKKPLIVLNTADFAINENPPILFPPNPCDLPIYSAHSITCATKRYLYLDMFCSLSADKPYTYLLIDLQTGATKTIATKFPVNKSNLSISPHGDKMVSIKNGVIFFINTESGEVIDSIDAYFKGKEGIKRRVISFNANWSEETININSLIDKNEKYVVEKLSIGFKNRKEKSREEIKFSGEKIQADDLLSERVKVSSSQQKISIADKKNKPLFFNPGSGCLLEPLSKGTFENECAET
jgi:hypothetical protein